jgi:glycosyltransferase involved in cell wall biosynthesis
MDLFAPIAREEARSRLGWKADERVALFAADPGVPRKRHWLAKAACERAADLVGELRLHVAGGMPPSEMPLLMSAADCLLLTSSIEGSPNVVKEALMCQLPVVATDTGDVRELLDGVEPSWVCADTPEALGAALVMCMRERRRSNGREVASRLGLEPIAQRVIGLYGSLAPDAVDGLPIADDQALPEPGQVPMVAGEKRRG